MDTRAFLKTLGLVLAERRRSLRLTQEALAERLDSTAQWVSEVERGGTPSVDMLLRLAEALGVTLPALMEAAWGEESAPSELRALVEEARGLSPEATRVLIATARALKAERMAPRP